MVDEIICKVHVMYHELYFNFPNEKRLTLRHEVFVSIRPLTQLE